MPEFVKSKGINEVGLRLAQSSRLKLAKKCAKTRDFRYPTSRDRFLNGINDIRGKCGLGPKLLCLLDQQIGARAKAEIVAVIKH